MDAALSTPVCEGRVMVEVLCWRYGLWPVVEVWPVLEVWPMVEVWPQLDVKARSAFFSDI